MFYLPCCKKLPELGVIPVVKTTEYPLSPFGTGPLCYLRAAAVEGLGLMLDLMCFEREPYLGGSGDPLLDSSAAAAVDLAPGKGRAPVFAVFNSLGDGGLYSPDGLPLRPLPASTYAGADEQGWYWGVRFYLSRELLAGAFGRELPRPGDRLLIAAYKFQNGPGGHFGAIAPVASPDIFCRENLREFTAISY